jgi:HAD superfamily hydrolase (TIGR01509 family)
MISFPKGAALITSSISPHFFNVEFVFRSTIASLWEKHLEELYSSCALLPGALKVVRGLKERGLKVCIATSSSSAAYALKSSYHPHFFNIFEGNVVTGDDVSNSKPHPEIYETAARKLGLETKKCFAFEDATAGCQSAFSAGCVTVAVPDVRIKDQFDSTLCHIVVDSLEDIDMDLLVKLEATPGLTREREERLR